MAEVFGSSHSPVAVSDYVDCDGEIRFEIQDGESLTWLSKAEVKALRRHLKAVLKGDSAE